MIEYVLVHNVKPVHNTEIRLITKTISIILLTPSEQQQSITFYILQIAKEEIIFLDGDQYADHPKIWKAYQYSLINFMNIIRNFLSTVKTLILATLIFHDLIYYIILALLIVCVFACGTK